MLPLVLACVSALAGEPNFPTRNYPVSEAISAVRSLDLDRDGFLDLICQRADSQLHWMSGNGTGEFESRGLVPGSLGMVAHQFADIDGDGWTDVVGRHTPTLRLALFLGDGLGGFAAPQPIDTGWFTVTAVGDLDGDGDLDCVAWEMLQQSLRVYLHTGAGFVRTTWSVPKVPCHGLLLGDLDGDGHVDLGVDAASRFVILHGDGTGSFGQRAELPPLFDPALADLDGKGAPEILGCSSGTISAVRHLGARKYTCTVLAQDVGWLLEVADADADGDVDVCVQLDRYARILFNDGSGRFQRERTLWMQSVEGPWAFGDLDGDGHADLAGPSSGRNVAVTILRPDDPQEVPLGRDAPVRTGALRDFDGDGELDLLLFRKEFAECLPGDGHGAFRAPRSSEVGSWYPWVTPVCVDVDADGDFDIVRKRGARLTGALNDGTGRFSAPIDLPAFEGRILASADLDGDGTTDVVSVDDDGLRCHFGLPGGGVDPLPVGIPGPRWESWLADFTGDGRADILSRSFEPPGFAVYSWGPTEAFELVAFTPRSQTETDEPGDAPRDVNGDGHLDVVLLNGVKGEIHALLGDGAGRFPASVRSDAGNDQQLIRGVTLVNVDRDPHADLVSWRIGNQTENELVVWPGLGDGRFGEAVVILNPGWTALLADLDHDGRSEMVLETFGWRAQLIRQR